MLLELAKLLEDWISGFHLFQYLTFRAIMSALTALAVSLLVGPSVIRKLAELKAGQVVRSDGPQTHLVKAGTPTMGGGLILLAITVSTLLWMDLRNRCVWIVLLVMGGVIVMETASVMIQVASFKLTGKRVFRMAPIHHHFELKGWPAVRSGWV